MYLKNQSFVPAPSQSEQRNSQKKNDFKAQPPTKDYLGYDTRKQDYSKTIEVNRKPEYVEKKHDYLDKKFDSHDKRYDQQHQGFDKKQFSSNSKPQEFEKSNQNLINQLKEEQQQTDRLRAELNLVKEREMEFQKRLSKLEQDYEQKHKEDRYNQIEISIFKLKYRKYQIFKQSQKIIYIIQDENKNLHQKLNQVNKHLNEESNRVRQYEQQIRDLEQALNENVQEQNHVLQNDIFKKEYQIYMIILQFIQMNDRQIQLLFYLYTDKVFYMITILIRKRFNKYMKNQI